MFSAYNLKITVDFSGVSKWVKHSLKSGKMKDLKFQPTKKVKILHFSEFLVKLSDNEMFSSLWRSAHLSQNFSHFKMKNSQKQKIPWKMDTTPHIHTYIHTHNTYTKHFISTWLHSKIWKIKFSNWLDWSLNWNFSFSIILTFWKHWKFNKIKYSIAYRLASLHIRQFAQVQPDQ